MTIQYLTDQKGKRRFVQVQIPIREWEKAEENIIISKNENNIEKVLEDYTADDYRKAVVMRGNKILAKSMKKYPENHFHFSITRHSEISPPQSNNAPDFQTPPHRYYYFYGHVKIGG